MICSEQLNRARYRSGRGTAAPVEGIENLTLDVASAEAAVARAKEILGLVIELTGFTQLDFAAASKIMAEVVAA